MFSSVGPIAIVPGNNSAYTACFVYCNVSATETVFVLTDINDWTIIIIIIITRMHGKAQREGAPGLVNS